MKTAAIITSIIGSAIAIVGTGFLVKYLIDKQAKDKAAYEKAHTKIKVNPDGTTITTVTEPDGITTVETTNANGTTIATKAISIGDTVKATAIVNAPYGQYISGVLTPHQGMYNFKKGAIIGTVVAIDVTYKTISGYSVMQDLKYKSDYYLIKPEFLEKA